MHKLATAIAAAIGSLVLLSAASVDAATPSAPATNRYVVVFKSGTLPADAALRVRANGGKVTRSFQQVGVATVQGDAAFAARMAKIEGGPLALTQQVEGIRLCEAQLRARRGQPLEFARR